MRRVSFLVLMMMLTLAVVPASAMNLYSYDLDSLAFMSPDIVEAKAVRSFTGSHNLLLFEMKITAVHKGGMKVGDSVTVAAMDFYRLAKLFESNDHEADALTGHEFFLFLVKAKSAFAFEVPENANIYMTVPSGLKLVSSQGVKGFRQMENPGPYRVEYENPQGKKSFPSLDEFREKLKAGIKKSDGIAERLKTLALPKDAPWVLQVLRERPHTRYFFDRDDIGEELSVRLANSHDFDALAEAAPIKLCRECTRILMRGFGIPQGREALLKKMGDPAEPMEKRVALAKGFFGVGSNYALEISGITRDALGKETGEATPQNAAYLTRAAQVAADNEKSEELCAALVRNIGACINLHMPRPVTLTGDRGSKGEPSPDEEGAVTILKKLHPSTKSELLKYEIEYFMQSFNLEEYKALHSKCGPVLSIARRLEVLAPVPGKLIYDFDIHVLEDNEADKQHLTFVNTATGQRFESLVDFGVPHHPGSGPRGGNVVSLPKDLPHGKYHIHLEFLEGKKVVSTGYGFEMEL